MAKLARDEAIALKIAAIYPHAKVLDVGSGRGEFLVAATKVGLTSVGLELSDAMVEDARATYGVTVLNETAEEHATKSQSYDAFVLNAVIEHVMDPDALIKHIRKMARPGALLYIDCPNEPNLLTQAGDIISRIRRSPKVLNLAPTFPPYHVWGFNLGALKVLLDKYEFQIDSHRIYASPKVPSNGGLDTFKSLIATQVNRIANLTGRAHNLYLWSHLKSP